MQPNLLIRRASSHYLSPIGVSFTPGDPDLRVNLTVSRTDAAGRNRLSIHPASTSPSQRASFSAVRILQNNKKTIVAFLFAFLTALNLLDFYFKIASEGGPKPTGDSLQQSNADALLDIRAQAVPSVPPTSQEAPNSTEDVGTELLAMLLKQAALLVLATSLMCSRRLGTVGSPSQQQFESTLAYHSAGIL